MNAILVAAGGGVVSVWKASDLDVKYGLVGGRCDVLKWEGVDANGNCSKPVATKLYGP